MKEFGPVHAYVALDTLAVDNVIEVPAHTGELVVILGIEGIAFTVVTIAFEVAGLPVTPTALEVMIHVTDCPFVNDVVVYVALFVPTFEPFTCHW